MRRTISGRGFEGRSIELGPVSAVSTNLCQGKTTMFLHKPDELQRVANFYSFPF